MARPLRVQFPGAIYHIISRGIDGRNILDTDKDKQYLLKLFLHAKKFYKLEIYLYCLLNNHYHFSMETPLGNVSKVLHWINTTYTSWYNKVYERKGHLFQGRYKSILVDKDEYLLELSKYIHLNPVKAGIVNRPEDYKWSSYRMYVGLETNTFLNTDFILNQFGHSLDHSKMAYKKFVEDGIAVDDDIMKKLTKGFILGNKEFVKTIAEKVKDLRADPELPQLKKLRKTIDIDEFFKTIESDGIDINKKGIWGNIERDVIVYLCKRFTLEPNAEIGRMFGLTGAAVSYICKKIEKCKDKEEVKGMMGKIAKKFDF